MAYKQISLNRDPIVSGIRGGTDQAHFPDAFWQKHPKLEQFMFGNDNSAYMAGLQPNFPVMMEGVTLNYGAKLTDFMSVGALLRGYVISDRLKNLLQPACLPDHKFYEVTFHQFNRKKELIKQVDGYWWFYFQMETGEQNVNFEASVFDHSVHDQRYPDQISSPKTFTTYQEIFEQYPPAMYASKLVLKPSFDRTQDFWGTRFLTISNYISEGLLEKFESAKITGYKVNEPKSQVIFE
ncbi:hypothetical protein [Spirosoma endbachense]|uniref:Uncharacterized protein n=1 Tax=Spirosoma endbachense TaxID=2666025 RepID=A0A6P1W5U6_9BACT|nr:hypothetical protein [Spirosoma endbachense]QHV99409.1 hypothetical protein GJR95_32305 [Spirosoma endbachense]